MTFNLHENGIKFSENTVRKGEIARYEQFHLFPVFSKDFHCRHEKTRLVWERLVPGKDEHYYFIYTFYSYCPAVCNHGFTLLKV